MFGFLKKDPAARLEKQLKKKYELAVGYQRNGRLREYGEISLEILELEKKIETLRKGQA